MQAQSIHDDVRERALKALEDHKYGEEQKRLEKREQEIKYRQRREEDRLRHEKKLRDEEERLRALQAQTVPKLPPKIEQPAPQPKHSPPNATASLNKHDAAASTQPNAAKSTAPVATGPPKNPFQTLPAKINGHASPAAPPSAAASPFAKSATSQPANPFTPATATAPKPATQAPVQTQPTKPPAAPEADRYVQIHKNLKKLRALMTEHAKTNPQLKKLMGEMRREIRKSLGQLTGGKGANKKQVSYRDMYCCCIMILTGDCTVGKHQINSDVSTEWSTTESYDRSIELCGRQPGSG